MTFTVSCGYLVGCWTLASLETADFPLDPTTTEVCAENPLKPVKTRSARAQGGGACAAVLGFQRFAAGGGVWSRSPSSAL